jgi:LPS sulfotransferase NodH
MLSRWSTVASPAADTRAPCCENVGMTAWDQFGPDYDFPEFTGQPQSYLIATTPRCGSHHLGHLLCGTGMLGSPLEYFSKGRLRDWQEKLEATSRWDLFEKLFRRRTSPSGWFGVKAHWPQFEQIANDPTLFPLFNFTRFIHIERRDRIAQAISWVIAQQSSAWISFHETTQEPTYDFAAIQNAVAVIDAQTETWKQFFASQDIKPLTVVYEDLVASPERAVDAVLMHCGLTRDPTQARKTHQPTRQASSRNTAWVERYHRDLAHTS